MEGLGFMQTYIDKHASFHPIGKDQTVKPIREKTDMPKYQVTMRNYFSIPNQRAFNNVSQDGGRVIKGSAVMGFSTDPQTCLDNASGDLRMMGCAIYFKKFQEVNTVATLMLVGAPNTIEEDIIKQTTDKELMVLEKKLLLTNMDYKLTKSQSKKMDLILSGEGISSRNAVGRSGGEKAKARNQQCQAGLRFPRTST